MGTVREKPEMELDQGSVEQVRRLFNDYVVDPLGKELKAAESDIRSNEETQMGALKEDLKTKLDGANSRLSIVLWALGDSKDPLANVQIKLDALEGTLKDNLDDLNLEGKLTAQSETLETSLTSHLGTLKENFETKLEGTNGRLEDVQQALGDPEDPLANVQIKLDALGGKLKGDLDALNLEGKLTAQNKTLETSLTSHLETLKENFETKLEGTNGRLENVQQALGDPEDPLANVQIKLDALGGKLKGDLDALDLEGKLTAQNKTLETSLTSHLGTLQKSLCGSLAENTAQLTEQSDAEQKAVLERVAVLEQQLLTAVGSSSTQMTQYRDDARAELADYQKTQQQLAAQKYKLLLGTSLAFGIVNFLGIVLLLYLNFMP